MFEAAGDVLKCLKTDGLSVKCLELVGEALTYLGYTLLYVNIQAMLTIITASYKALKACLFGRFLLL